LKVGVVLTCVLLMYKVVEENLALIQKGLSVRVSKCLNFQECEELLVLLERDDNNNNKTLSH